MYYKYECQHEYYAHVVLVADFGLETNKPPRQQVIVRHGLPGNLNIPKVRSDVCLGRLTNNCTEVTQRVTSSNHAVASLKRRLNSHSDS